MSNSALPGKVWLIGAGPGAADLLTVRATRLLEQTQVVLHDALVSEEILQLAPQATLINVGKRANEPSSTQSWIHDRMIEAAQTHAHVVRLKGGDPSMFGRAQEEVDALKAAGIECEVVPGITAALAASADLALSLTRRGVARSVLFATPVTGPGEPDNGWAVAAAQADTVALYMASNDAAAVRDALLAQGRAESTPAHVVMNAGRANMRSVSCTLGTLPEALASRGRAPTIVLLGEVYRHAESRNKF